MTDTTTPQPVTPLDTEPTPTGYAVYDEAELRFVESDGRTVHADKAAADKAARGLNDGNEVGRADGKSGKRYVVKPV